MMDILVSFIVCFFMLITSVYRGIFVGYPLAVGLIIFIFCALKRGYKLKETILMAYNGGKKSVTILQIFVLIGAITAIWMASGTVSAIVFYGVEFLNPHLFILSAFLISCIVSFLIGTSFGTVGTVGIALMVIARGGGENVGAAAGAIIAGAYFGDRCSPMSSSANLVAFLTDTDIYDNIKNMLKTSVVPFILSIILYTIVSMKFPVSTGGSGINNEIIKVFNINIFVLLPAFIIFILSLLKINVKTSMFFSIICAVFLSMFFQHNSFVENMKYIIWGYSIKQNSNLSHIIKGGGIISMLKTSLVVFISSAFSGIFEGTGMLSKIENYTKKSKSRFGLFKNTVITSIFTSIFGCSQALSVILTHMLNNKAYENKKSGKSYMAVDLENSAIVVSAIIPWNIALLLPMVNLNADNSCIPYLFYLYLVPLTNLAIIKIKNKVLEQA